jgi:uncharacterized protein (TIGR00730 family)
MEDPPDSCPKKEESKPHRKNDFPTHKKIHTLDAWRVLRIVSELVEGFETMISLGPSVAFFGSSIPHKDDDVYYQLTKNIAQEIVKKGFGIITGGGPGFMEAANRGALEVKGKSCGLCIDTPLEEQSNLYITPRYHLHHRYFFIRKIMFVRYAQAFVVMPGGFGTLDEFFEALTLIKTKKIKPFPVYLVGSTYWQGLLDWLKHTVVEQGYIHQQDLSVFTVTDDPKKIAHDIQQHYEKTTSFENF